VELRLKCSKVSICLASLHSKIKRDYLLSEVGSKNAAPTRRNRPNLFVII
jgi:hypothetical protein